MRKILLREEKGMEQEIRNDALSDIMCDLLYLLGCGVNGKMPAKTYIKTFQKVYDEDKMQMLYQFSKVHFVDALTGTEKCRYKDSSGMGTEYCQSNSQGYII